MVGSGQFDVHLFGLRKDVKLIQDIKTYLMKEEYHEIVVNIEKIQLFYVEKTQDVNVFVLLDMPSGNEFTRLQFNNIIRQINARFTGGEYQKIHILSVILTRNVDVIRSFSEEEVDTWIIDLNEMRLIRYENQDSTFDTLYKGLEDIIYEKNLTGSSKSASDNLKDVHTFKDKYKEHNEHEMYNKKYHFKKKSIYNKLPFEIINLILVAINVVLFLGMDLFQLQDKFYSMGALYWPYIEYNNEYYRLISSMFIHGSIDHLINNMLVLLFIGDTLERSVGKIKYLVIYFTSGVIAGIVSMRYNMIKGVLVQSVGASGAIFGVVGAVAFLVIANKGRLKDISTRQIFIFVVLSLYGGLSSQGIDNAAHIGGLIAGVIISAVLFFIKNRGGQYH